MNRVERKGVERVLRAAIDGTADEVRSDELAPLHLMPRTGVVGSGYVRARPGMSRPVAALTAAAAVLALAAASFGAASALRADRAEMTGPHPTAAPLSLIPRYSMVLATTARRLQVAKVVDSVTRKVVATIRAPKPYSSFTELAGASDAQTFVLDAQVWKYVGQHHDILDGGPSQLFVVTLSQGPGPVQVTLAPLRTPVLPAHTTVESLALSPAGTKVAFAFAGRRGAPNYQTTGTRLWIYSLATATLRKFHGQWQIGHGVDDPAAMSWAADDRTLALDFTGGSSPLAVELFDATAAGGTIASHSRPLIHVTANPSTYDAYLLADGSKVLLGRWYSGSDPNELAEVSAATGRTARTIVLNPPLVDGAVPSLADVQWASSSGSVMILVFTNRSLGHIGESIHMLLHNGKLTPFRVGGTPNATQRAW